MKVVKKKGERIQSYSVQLLPSTMAKVDEAAQKADMSRQKLIEAVLKQVLSDPKFVLRVTD